MPCAFQYPEETVRKEKVEPEVRQNCVNATVLSGKSVQPTELQMFHFHNGIIVMIILSA